MTDEIVSRIWLSAGYSREGLYIIGTIPVFRGEDGLYYQMSYDGGDVENVRISCTAEQCAHKHIPARFGDGGLTVDDFPGFEAGEYAP